MLLRRARREEEPDVAAWPVAGLSPGVDRNFFWALTLAGGWGRGGRVGRAWQVGLDQGWLGLALAGWRVQLGAGRAGWLGLDMAGWRVQLGAGRALLSAAAITAGLVPAVLFTVGGSPVALTGMPAPPASGGLLAGRAAVTCLGPLGQEPAFTPFEQAKPAAGMPTARATPGAGWLTLRQCAWKLSMAHGRYCSRVVRRREGDASRRHFALTT
jgi:hypothetical protein